MRVEVLMFLKIRGNGDDCDGVENRAGDGEDREWVEGNMERKIRPFRLSGEVVEVRPAPSLQRSDNARVRLLDACFICP